MLVAHVHGHKYIGKNMVSEFKKRHCALLQSLLLPISDAAFFLHAAGCLYKFLLELINLDDYYDNMDDLSFLRF